MNSKIASLVLFLGLSYLPTPNAARASDVVVSCRGEDVEADIVELGSDVFDLQMRWGRTRYRFQTNGIVRSTRGFVTMGTQGLVYEKNEAGDLKGWIAIGGDIAYENLECRYER